MKKLYAPWRSPYASSIVETKKENTGKKDCVFCIQFAQKDDENHFILKRGKTCAVVLNLYPYNAGHLLILPFEHTPSLETLPKATRTELMELISQSTTIMTSVIKTDGINVGINLGKAAGAGIPGHLHVHILPRWNGDTNFLPTLADTKQVSFDLKKIYTILKKAF